MTRYVVLGPGAVGGVIGGRLHEAGHDVVLVARGAHLETLRRRGLRVDEPGRSRVLAVRVVGAPGDVDWRPGDVTLLATKTQDSAGALDALARAAPAVPVACAQNGVANERLAAERFAEVQAICVMLPAEHLEPGRVVAYSAPIPGILDVGRYPTGTDALTDRIAADLRGAGFSSLADPAVMRAKYGKLLSNLGNAAEAACGPDDPELAALVMAARTEGERCLAAAGITFVPATEEAARRGDLITMHPVAGATRRGGSSWQSLARATGSIEAEFLNGEMVELGRQHGVPTPVNAMLQRVAVQMARRSELPGSRCAAGMLRDAHDR